MTTYRLVAADWRTRLAELDIFESAQITLRYNDVSTWRLTAPAELEAISQLRAAARPRLIVYADDEILTAGPVIRPEESVDVDGDMVTFTGADDTVWLARRLAHPEPTTAAPPYSTTAYDVQLGAASVVLANYVNRNAGPGAIAARRVPDLTAPAPAALGPTIRAQARYENLLELLGGIAAGADLGFRVRDLVFEVYEPMQRAVFSAELGTLAGWTVSAEAPELNYVYVAGQGEGTARTIRERSSAASITDWGRIEAFQDRRDEANTAELDRAGDETIAQAVVPAAAALSVIETPSQSFLVDWHLGDQTTVVAGGATFSDVIREVTITLGPNQPPDVVPAVGKPAVDLAIFRRLANLESRLRQLEKI